MPRTKEDFGDGGAFPEIHVAQYPLDMGRADKKSTAIVAVNVAGGAKSKVFSSATDLVEKPIDPVSADAAVMWKCILFAAGDDLLLLGISWRCMHPVGVAERACSTL